MVVALINSCTYDHTLWNNKDEVGQQRGRETTFNSFLNLSYLSASRKVTRTLFSATNWPTVNDTRSIVPSIGARMTCSIFMASRIISGVPFLTFWPDLQRTCAILHGLHHGEWLSVGLNKSRRYVRKIWQKDTYDAYHGGFDGRSGCTSLITSQSYQTTFTKP